MAEPGRVEQREQKPPMKVVIPDSRVGEHNTRIGQLINDVGSTFDLGNIYNISQLGGDQFSEVYFRTDSGNIYMLDKRGRLVNANETEKHKGEKWGAVLDRAALKDKKLTVGEPFVYQGGNTSRITEIVATNERVYPSTEKGSEQQSTILQDFQKKVPPQPL